MRIATLRHSLFPFLRDVQLTQADKDQYHNVNGLRETMKSIIIDRQNAIKKDPKELEKGDLITILLSDDLFKNNIEMIIDECITFFLAGS
jgi:cytochrome P450